MSITKTIELYHGTSLSQLRNIEKEGFNCSYKDYSFFLSAYGIYFVADRPSIALKFAKKAVFDSVVENDEPIIFSIQLYSIETGEILDLTTDIGLNRFWKEYHRAYKAFKSQKNEKTREFEKLYPDYFSFLGVEKSKTITDEFVAYFDAFLPNFKPNKTNIDSFVLDWMTREYKIIIAAIQEGNPFQYQLFKNLLNYESIPAFKGIRIRDHIEVCVTDTACINTFSLKRLDISQITIEEEFLDYIVFKGDDKY